MEIPGLEGYDKEVKLTIELDREADGHWIAEALMLQTRVPHTMENVFCRGAS